VLTLHLKRKWWEQIRAGVKRSELRVNSPRNRTLLANRRFDEIRLWLGYPPRHETTKLLRFRHRRTQMRVLGYHPEFGKGPHCVWEIVLGARLA
jgi:hypothetical protein